MHCYPEPDSLIRDKVIVVLDLSNYTTKKELDHATSVDTSDLAVKKIFFGLKAEVDKLDINKLVNVPTSYINLKAKVSEIENKIPDISSLVTTTVLNSKISVKLRKKFLIMLNILLLKNLIT